MRALLYLMITVMLCAPIARAEGEATGDFDYYVLALSWSPTYCALEGDARHSPQCTDQTGFGWVLHGLWPQYEQGWPSYCRNNFPAPSRGDTAEMADIMGSGGAAWYQWKKHGTCAGLAARDYFRLARLAYESITRPPVFRKLVDSVRLPASVVQDAFLDANPALAPDMITITCKQGRIQEARLCLTHDLHPRICAENTIRDCSLDRALLEPMR